VTAAGEHPERVALLAALEWIGEPCSPVQLAPCLGTTLGNASYHLRVLDRDGEVEVAATHEQGGAQERFYRLAEA
jgi:hypothetical protein